MAGPCDITPFSPNASQYPGADNPDAVAQIIAGVKNRNDFPNLTQNDLEIINNESGAINNTGDALFQADLAALRARANASPIGQTQTAANANNSDEQLSFEEDIINGSQVNEDIPPMPEPLNVDFKRNIDFDLSGPSTYGPSVSQTADKSKWIIDDGLLLCTRVWDGEPFAGSETGQQINKVPIPPDLINPHPNYFSVPTSIPKNGQIHDTFRYFSGKYWVLLDGDGPNGTTNTKIYNNKNPNSNDDSFTDASYLDPEAKLPSQYRARDQYKKETQYFSFHNPSNFIAGPREHRGDGDRKSDVMILPLDKMSNNLDRMLHDKMTEFISKTAIGDTITIDPSLEQNAFARGASKVKIDDFVKNKVQGFTNHLRDRMRGNVAKFARAHIQNNPRALSSYTDPGITEWRKEVFCLRIPHPRIHRPFSWDSIADMEGSKFNWIDYFYGYLVSARSEKDHVWQKNIARVKELLTAVIAKNISPGDVQKAEEFLRRYDELAEPEVKENSRGRLTTGKRPVVRPSGLQQFVQLIDEMAVSEIRVPISKHYDSDLAGSPIPVNLGPTTVPLKRWFQPERGQPYYRGTNAGYSSGEKYGFSFVLPTDIGEEEDLSFGGFNNYNMTPVFPFYELDTGLELALLTNLRTPGRLTTDEAESRISSGRRVFPSNTDYNRNISNGSVDSDSLYKNFRAPTIGAKTFLDHVTNIELPYSQQEMDALNIKPMHYNVIKPVYNFFDELYETLTQLNTEGQNYPHHQLPNHFIFRPDRLITKQDIENMEEYYDSDFQLQRFKTEYGLINSEIMNVFNCRFRQEDFLQPKPRFPRHIRLGPIRGNKVVTVDRLKAFDNVCFFTNPNSDHFKSAYKERILLPMFVEFELGSRQTHGLGSLFNTAGKIDTSNIFYPFYKQNLYSDGVSFTRTSPVSVKNGRILIRESFTRPVKEDMARKFSRLSAVQNFGISSESAEQTQIYFQRNMNLAEAAYAGISFKKSNPNEPFFSNTISNSTDIGPPGPNGYSLEDLENLVNIIGNPLQSLTAEYLIAFQTIKNKEVPRRLVEDRDFYVIDQHLFGEQSVLPVHKKDRTPTSLKREPTSKYRAPNDLMKFTEAIKTSIPTMSLEEWLIYVDSGIGMPESDSTENGFEKVTSIFSKQTFISNIKKIINTTQRTYSDIMAGKTAHNEPIGYKIEKYVDTEFLSNLSTEQREALENSPSSIPGLSEFDLANRSKPVQTYYLSLDDNIDLIKYCDSQVKYGIVYKYVISTVCAIIGTEYAYIDLMEDEEAAQFDDWAKIDKQFNDINMVTYTTETQTALESLGTERRSAGFNTTFETRTFSTDPNLTVEEASRVGLLSQERVQVREEEFYDHFLGFQEVEVSKKVFKSLPQKLKLTEIGGDEKDTHFHWPFAVMTRPSVQIMEVPTTVRTIAILDKPPTPPDVDIIPFRGIDNKVMFNINDMTGKFTAKPIILEDDDRIQFTISAYNQLIHPDDINFDLDGTSSNSGFTLLEFKNDDLSKIFEVFRISKPPKSWSDFYGKKIAKIEQQDATAAAFIDDIVPNKKYYYTFRCEDVHGHVSNPSHIYEVELVNEYGAVYLNAKLYEPKEDFRQAEKPLRKYIKLKPSFIQKIIDLNENNTLDNWETKNEFTPGIATNKVWGKKLKIRIKSKSTGKQLDLNLTFSKKYNKINGDGVIEEYD